MNRTLTTMAALVLALGSGLVAAQTPARSFDISFTNVYSSAERGADDNSSFTVQLAPLAYLTTLSWTADLTAFGPSYLSEMTLELTNSAGEGVQISPADGVDAAGHQLTSGQLDLVNTGMSFRLLADGQLHLAFVDSYDDIAGQPDGRWNSAALHVGYTAAVPEPTTALMLALGLTGLALRRRRAAQLPRLATSAIAA